MGGGKITNNGVRDKNNADRERQIPPTASPGLRKTHKHNQKAKQMLFQTEASGKEEDSPETCRYLKRHKGPSDAFLIPLKSLTTTLGHTYTHTLAKYDPLLLLCVANPAKQ